MENVITPEDLKRRTKETYRVKPFVAIVKINKTSRGLTFNVAANRHLGAIDKVTLAFDSDNGTLTFRPARSGESAFPLKQRNNNPVTPTRGVGASKLLRFLGVREDFNGRLPAKLHEDGSVSVNIKKILKKAA